MIYVRKKVAAHIKFLGGGGGVILILKNSRIDGLRNYTYCRQMTVNILWDCKGDD